jgi:hypothetical protein
MVIGHSNGNSHYSHGKSQLSWEFPSGPMGLPNTPKLDGERGSYQRIVTKITDWNDS